MDSYYDKLVGSSFGKGRKVLPCTKRVSKRPVWKVPRVTSQIGTDSSGELSR